MPMRITIESTDEVGTINGVPCRKWLGVTEGGTPCFVFVPRIAVEREHEEAFDRERLPSPVLATGFGDLPDGPSRREGNTPTTFDARLFS